MVPIDNICIYKYIIFIYILKKNIYKIRKFVISFYPNNIIYYFNLFNNFLEIR